MRALGSYKFQDFSPSSISNMKTYLIYSQLLDWDLQGYVDNFCRIIKDKCEKKGYCDFPFLELSNYVQNNRRRRVDLTAEDLNADYQRWFVLKIVTPDKPFTFLEDPDERFNPEIDHIFPPFPGYIAHYPVPFYDLCDSVCNLQPVKGSINALKLDTQPKDFFTQYPKYLKDYDFLPTEDLNDRRWLPEHADEFLQSRKGKIILWIRNHFGLRIKS